MVKKKRDIPVEQCFDLTLAYELIKFKYFTHNCPCHIGGSCDITQIDCDVYFIGPCDITLILLYEHLSVKYLNFTYYGTNVTFKGSCMGNITKNKGHRNNVPR